MKKYTVKENEDLGSIAQKFGMVSWKYLYEINQQAIGDNPDLLKPGTRLEIPRWDATSGDEKIKAKDADPFKYTGGVRYRYPWVPFSLSLTDEFGDPLIEYDEQGNALDQYSQPVKLYIVDDNKQITIGSIEARRFDEAEALIPDSPHIKLCEESINSPRGTITELVRIFQEVEAEEGIDSARHFSHYINYESVCALVKKGGPDNDPNAMPTRFMLLPGMSDALMQHIDNHPDVAQGKPPHPMNIANLRKGLGLLGFPVTEGSLFDESVYKAILQYLSTVDMRKQLFGMQYTVVSGDSIGGISDGFGLPSWKYLYQINQNHIGSDPHVLTPGTVLEIPQWDTTSGDEKLLQAGFDAFSFCGGTCFRYPWVPFSLKLNDRTGAPMTGFDSPTNVNITDRKTKKSLFKASISQLSELDMLLPDCGNINVGIQGLPIILGSIYHKYEE